MIIPKKSVEILLRSSIENNIKDFNEEINFLISKAVSRPKSKKDLEDIKNKASFYFENSSRSIIGGSQGSSPKSNYNNLIESNDLYKVYYPEDIKYVQLVYNSETKNKIKTIFNNRIYRNKLLEHNVSPINNILLYGEPGTGKTQIAMNIAKDLKLPIVLVRLDEVISSYLGKTGKNIKEIFDIVEKNNCILFFDELDALGKKRDDNQELGELKRVVTVFLQNLDIVKHQGIILGATNHPELIDKALWRRFDTYIETTYPEPSFISKIFETYINEEVQKTLKIKNIDISKYVHNISGAYIEKIAEHINRASIISGDYSIAAILKSFLESLHNSKYGDVKQSDKYSIARILYKDKISIKTIANIMNIPYTTLRDNILNKNKV